MNSGTAPQIHRATVGDATALAELGTATFVETFGHLYPREDLEQFLCESHSVTRWGQLLGDPAVAAWLAAISGTAPVGFILAGSCKLPVTGLEQRAGEIRQLYVRASHQGLRLGTRLLETALDWLAANGRSPVYVGVWSENVGAQRLYQRYGFEKIGEYFFPVGRTRDREFILKRSDPS
jgi:ribosomal protein S18 acetylase RimI-like enzyme